MLKSNKEICTEIILGIIVDIKETTQNASKIITAEYKVDDQIFIKKTSKNTPSIATFVT